MSIPDWLSWNQNSVFESQSEIDTWQGGIYKSCRLLRGRRQLHAKERGRLLQVRWLLLEKAAFVREGRELLFGYFGVEGRGKSWFWP